MPYSCTCACYRLDHFCATMKESKHQQVKGQKVNAGAANITWHVQFWRVRGDHQRGRSKQGDWQLYEPSLFVGLADRFSTWKKVDKYIQVVKGLDKSRYIVRKRGSGRHTISWLCNCKLWLSLTRVWSCMLHVRLSSCSYDASIF